MSTRKQIVKSIRKRTCMVSGYSCNYAYRKGCRCVECIDNLRERLYRTINRNRKRVDSTQKPVEKRRCYFPSKAPYTGYQYGCRCRRCMDGHNAAVARYRAKRKERESNGERHSRTDGEA
jgi:hypothetical protein